MLFRTVAPVRRKGTANHSYQRRIPADVRDRAAGLTVLVPIGPEKVRYTISEKADTIRISLRTPIPAEVKHRNGEVDRFFETIWKSLRSSQPIALTHQQCVALAGEVFDIWSNEQPLGADLAIEYEETKVGAPYRFIRPTLHPLEAGGMAERYAELASDREAMPLGDLERDFGRNLDHRLREKGLGAIDADSRALVLWEVLRAMRDAWTVQKRMAEGDFSPPPEANRFPEWVGPKPVAVADPPKPDPRSAAMVSLKGLLGLWWAEAKLAGRSQSTLDSYRATIDRFAAFVKHDDAQRVTNADVLRFKDHRIAAGASLKTVKDSDLVGLRALFNHAVDARLVAANPVEGVKVMRIKKARTRPQGFTPDEAKAILAKSLGHVPAANEKPQTAAAKRWVPWVCAYTGARVGEVVQLRKEDVKRNGDWWTITITPEAGTVKNKELREVVLHDHLVELGFPEFVAAAKPGHLFFAAQVGENTRGKWQATKNRLAEFARDVVPDERVRPNHGWRHLFRTIGRESGIADSILDAVGGWVAKSVGETYGDVSLAAQATAFAKFPRFAVRPKQQPDAS